jgi:hypothetical protein
MPQLFARPRTPNDNPFIESAFSTVKRALEYGSNFSMTGAPAGNLFDLFLLKISR